MNKERGQVLVVVVSLMVITLAIGVGISSRYIKRLRGIIRTDNSSRSLAIAEAAVENLLLLPISTLKSYASGTSCGDDCLLEITGSDGVSAIATVDITELGNSQDDYLVNILEGGVGEVNLVNYPSDTPINICWNEDDVSISVLYIYGTEGNYDVDAYAYNSSNSSNTENGFDFASTGLGYTSCFAFNTKNASFSLRIHPLYTSSVVAVVPNQGNFIPSQGVQLESTGYINDVARTVRVSITEPVLPSIFDYALYQKSETEPLSN